MYFFVILTYVFYFLGRLKNSKRPHVVAFVRLSVRPSVCQQLFGIHFFIGLYLVTDQTKQVHIWHRYPLGLSWFQANFCVEVELKGKGQRSFQGHMVHKAHEISSFSPYLKNGLGQQLQTWYMCTYVDDSDLWSQPLTLI